MDIVLLLLVLAAIAVAVFFTYKKMFGRRDVERVLKEDPAAQEEYHHAKHQEENKEQTLTMQEKVELSWKFLTDITQQVVSKFSTKDKGRVQEAGEKLLEYGMNYEHNVAQEVKLSRSKVKSIAKTKTKSKGKSR